MIKTPNTDARIRTIREPNALTTTVSELKLSCPFLSLLLPVFSGVLSGVFIGNLLNVILGAFPGDLLNVILGAFPGDLLNVILGAFPGDLLNVILGAFPGDLLNVILGAFPGDLLNVILGTFPGDLLNVILGAFPSDLLNVILGVFPGDLLNVILGVFPGDLLNVIFDCWFVFPCIGILSVGFIFAPVVEVGVPCTVSQSSSHNVSLRDSISPVQSLSKHGSVFLQSCMPLQQLWGSVLFNSCTFHYI